MRVPASAPSELRFHAEKLFCIAPSANSPNLLLTGSKDFSWALWDFARNRDAPINSVRIPDAWVWDVEFSPDDRLIAASTENKGVTLYTASDQQPVGRYEASKAVYDMRFSPDSTLLVAAGANPSSQLMLMQPSSSSLAVLHNVNIGQSLRSVRFVPGEFKLCLGAYDGTIRFHDLETHSEISRFTHTESKIVRCVAMSPAHPTLVMSGAADGTLLVHDYRANCRVATHDPSWATIYYVDASPNGDGVVMGGASNDLIFWDMRKMGVEHVARGVHSDFVWQVRFNATGTCVWSGSIDKLAKSTPCDEFAGPRRNASSAAAVAAAPPPPSSSSSASSRPVERNALGSSGGNF